MTTFPGGIFTIVNDDTGRAVRTWLGATRQVGQRDLKDGTDHLDDWSGKSNPVYVSAKPGLGLGAADGTVGTAWRFTGNKDGGKIVSYPVSEYQNIGDYCVWMGKPDRDTADVAQTMMKRLELLTDMSADLKKKLDPLVQSAHEIITSDPRNTLKKDLSAEDFAKTWNVLCALHDEDNPRLGEDATAAVKAYLDAVAKEGVRLPDGSSMRGPTYLRGTGAERYDNSYWWVYDGTYIYSADHRCEEPELTYWTDNGGSLVGMAKQEIAKGSGQTWTAVRWTPPAS
ncbi:hypothetical protein ACFWY6_20185 [Streptomyces sp. NPDC059037]|uniref:hypothetical protein n=1 Tax=Streptomyces sp. NPDC059037 TaxID=3346710 RepID=UPI00368283C7